MPLKRGRLAARRKTVGFSQDQLAERLKVDRSTVARWESGDTEPQPWIRPRLARALQVSVDQLDGLLTDGGITEDEDVERLDYALTHPGSADVATAAHLKREVQQLASTPPPEANRVLEHMFGSPIRQLPAPVDPAKRIEVKEDPIFASSPSSSSFTPGKPEHASTAFWETGYNSDEELMRRRAFLLNVAALAGLGATDALAAIEVIRQELNLSLVEERATVDVDEWQEIALEYGESYPVLAPAELIRPLMVDMLGLQVALRRNTGTAAQRDLLRIAALLSAFTAQTITNMGHPHEARRWWRTAKSAADRSGDPYSTLWVRSREIIRAMETRPVTTILRLIGEAKALSDHAPATASLELIAGKAQTLALAGRKDDAVHTLAQLREQFGELSAGYSGSILSWGQERLHNTESFAYSRLGYFTETEAARTDGLALYDATNVRWPAGLELNLAFCLVRNGDVTEGLRHAQSVITRLPEGQRDSPLINDGLQLLSIVPLKDQRSAEAQQYRGWITHSIPEARE